MADVVKADTRAAIAAITPRVAGDSVFLAEEGREGIFVWKTVNLSAPVANDPNEGVYIKPSGQNGSTGAWVRSNHKPLNVRWFGAKGDGVANDTSALQAVIDFVKNVLGEGAVYVPSGTYILNQPINLPRDIKVMGDGMRASILQWTHTGHGFVKAEPVNSSSPVYLKIEALGLYNTTSGVTGAGFYDTCGTIISVRECQFYGWRYSVILDQSELVDIDLCEFGAASHSGVWLVNGPDLNPNVKGFFTNRISINRCQINSCAEFGILDDGGYVHAFTDNNYNGCKTHIRAAGVQGLEIRGGEFEGSSSSSIVLHYTKHSGVAVGQSGAVTISGMLSAPAAGNNVITIYAVGRLTLIGNAFGNTHSAAVPYVNGLAGCWGFFALGNSGEGDGRLTDGEANVEHFVAENFRKGSTVFDPPSISHQSSSSTTVSVPGAALGDFVDNVSFSGTLQGMTLTGYVSNTDQVTVVFSNLTGAAVDLPSGTVHVRVYKR